MQRHITSIELSLSTLLLAGFGKLTIVSGMKAAENPNLQTSLGSNEKPDELA